VEPFEERKVDFAGKPGEGIEDDPHRPPMMICQNIFWRGDSPFGSFSTTFL